jgi:hypothetical protein
MPTPEDALDWLNQATAARKQRGCLSAVISIDEILIGRSIVFQTDP